MLTLIVRNLWQKKARTALAIFGLALATGTLFSLIAFQRGYKRGLQQELSQLGAHILVVPKGCPYDAASLALHGANWPCHLKETYLSQVEQTRGVAVAAPVLMAAGHGAEREVLAGITSRYLELRPLWRVRGKFPSDPSEVLLGAEAARRFKTAVGKDIHLALAGQTARVSGILEPLNCPDDDFIFMRLEDAQTALNRRGQLTHLLVKLKSPELLEATVEALRGCDAGMQMNVVPLAHLFETIRKVSAAAGYLLAALSTIAFLVAGAALANTMLMAVLERTREIGVLRAIGASKPQIFILFLGETIASGVGGALLGLAGSFALSRWIEDWARGTIAYAPNAPLISADPVAVLTAVSFAMTLTILAGVAPALRAARLHPAAAFRAQAAY